MKNKLIPILLLAALLITACAKTEAPTLAEPVTTAIVDGEPVVDPTPDAAHLIHLPRLPM